MGNSGQRNRTVFRVHLFRTLASAGRERSDAVNQQRGSQGKKTRLHGHCVVFEEPADVKYGIESATNGLPEHGRLDYRDFVVREITYISIVLWAMFNDQDIAAVSHVGK